MRCLCILLFCAAFAGADEPKTLMTERGKLLHSEDFNKPPVKEWKVGKGKWEVVDGVLRGSELKSDMHGAVMRYLLDFDAIVIQYDFRLDGAKQTTLSINAPKGHICRVVVNAAGISVRKDQDKKKKEKGEILGAVKTPISPGAWHTLVLELKGKEMVASLDGKHVAYGTHDAIDVKKANFGLTVAGESASFKNLRVWEAQANKSWDATRAKLKGRGKGE
ncbi:MAG: family 16 glycoside hydrolase [Gemmataceae bacterium]